MSEEEFPCNLCGRTFDTKRGLSSHQTQSHPDMDEEQEGEDSESQEEESFGQQEISIELGIKSIAATCFIFGVFVGLSGGLLIGDTPAAMDRLSGDMGDQQAPTQQGSDTGGQDAGTQETDTGEITFTSELPYDAEIGTASGTLDWNGDTVDVEGQPYLGSPDAEVQIVSYEDFFCPFCARHNTETFPQIVEEYAEDGQVQMFYKHFPVVGGEMPAIASECVAQQSAEAFWLFKYNHFENFEQLRSLQQENPQAYQEEIVSWAEPMGIDQEEFDSCVENSGTESILQQDFEEAQNLGVEATPWVFVNGEEVRGAQSYETFRQLIENQLN